MLTSKEVAHYSNGLVLIMSSLTCSPPKLPLCAFLLPLTRATVPWQSKSRDVIEPKSRASWLREAINIALSAMLWICMSPLLANSDSLPLTSLSVGLLILNCIVFWNMDVSQRKANRLHFYHR